MKFFSQAVSASGQKWLAFYLALVGNLTDIKIANVGIMEMSILPLAVIFLTNGVNKIVAKLIILFTSMLFVTIVLCNNLVIFEHLPDTIGILKSPGVISFSRYFQLLLCLFLVNYVFFYAVEKRACSLGQHYSNNDPINSLISYFLSFNAVFTIFYIVTGFISFAGLEIFTYYGEHRLKGFFVEGGPLGLYYSGLFALAIYLKEYKKSILFLITVILTQSKAGGISIIFFFAFFILASKLKIHLLPSEKIKLTNYRAWISIGSMLAIVIVLISLFGEKYIQQMINAEDLLKYRLTDTSFIKGRISGVHISSNMIMDSPLIGVGLGNYSLLRNNEQYRGFFPIVETWDLTGLGGLITLITENGFIFFSIFIFLIYNSFLTKNSNAYESLFFFLLFITPFILGVQLYFKYPWIYMAFFLAKFTTKMSKPDEFALR